MRHICWYMRGEHFYKSLWFKTLQALSRTGRMLSCRQYAVFFPKSIAVIWWRTILTFSACRWVEYMQGISSRCTSISALAFAAGSPAGRSSPPHFVPWCICGSFPLSDNETSPCGCGGGEIETTARTYSSSDHHATPVWLIFLGLQTSNMFQENKDKKERSVFCKWTP